MIWCRDLLIWIKHLGTAVPGKDVNEQEFWRREWEKHQDSNAIVDVNVRGWLYAPQKGPTTRKQRLMIGLARQLSGVPAPSANRQDTLSGANSISSRNSSPTRAQEEELIALEADNIVRKGEREGQYARRGAFSENPERADDADSVYDNAVTNEPVRRGRHMGSYASAISSSYEEDSGTLTPVQKRSSWAAPSKMNQAELAVANSRLIARLKPFMANPLPNVAISAFFYNDSASRQQTVYTDAAGHFSFVTPLEFIPAHVRVLAGEKLSATEEVTITPPQGVSLISDIDDTIKHSAITSGAREIFRNAFIRELGDMTIDGVTEWYTTLHDMGVKIHYVSNSPWQMYPVLTSFFKLSKLPKGSFHLKMYTGMLQGIFEPVAERKKSSLDKIMRDFPGRKFVLIGDSGEADLEVYTDVAMDNPGRILGIFIRDVTTSVKTGYFDPSNSSRGGSRNNSRNNSRNRSSDSLAVSKRLSRPYDIRDDDADLKAAIAASLQDLEAETRQARMSINPDAPAREPNQLRNKPKERPQLPARRTIQGLTSGALKTSSPMTASPMTASPEEDLIDFTDPPPQKPDSAPQQRNITPSRDQGRNGVSSASRSALSPPPPPKPESLRRPSTTLGKSTSSDPANKQPPPRPRKPSSAVKPPPPPPTQTQIQPQRPSPLSQVTRRESMAKEPPPLPARPKNLKERFAQALPAVTARSPRYTETAIVQQPPRPRSSAGSARGRSSQPSSPLAGPLTSINSFDELNLPGAFIEDRKVAPPPPPCRQLSTLSMSSLKASHRLSSGAGSGWDDEGGARPSSPGGEPGVSKKEYLWKQRWSRAKDLLEPKGVTMRTWRVGSDVADVCVKLVEMAQREIKRGQ